MNAFISEFQSNPPGADPATTSVEISGLPGTSFSDFWLVSIESDAGPVGLVDSAVEISGTFDANGLFVADIPDLENPSFTLLLTEGFTGTAGATDLDADDDGVADQNLDLLGTVMDAVGIADITGDEVLLYGAQLGGTDLVSLNFEPEIVFRAGSTGAFFQVREIAGAELFDAAGQAVDPATFDGDVFATSFGAINPDLLPTGSFELSITEIWPGNEPGSNLGPDWFEITNTGTVAWSAATDGALFYDDDSQDPTVADEIFGIASLAAGESAIVLVDDADGSAAFAALWGSAIALTGVQIGFTDGSGLGQGGDGVTLFLDAAGDGVDAGDIVDFETYPDANATGGQSFDVTTGAFSVAGVNGAVATVTVNDEGQPAVGSPGNGAAIVAPAADFTLELLHFSDPESPAAGIIDAPNMSAVLNALRAQDIGEDGLPDNTLTIASGDLFLGGVFYNASAAVFGSAGIGDIQIMKELGVQASALGNHDFDFGTGVLAGLIDGSAPGDFSALVGTSLEGFDFAGTAFPYLSTNLDFSTDANLAPLEVAGGGAPLANTVTSSVVLDVNGEQVGLVGATTPTLDRISSPGDVGIAPVWAGTVPTPEELDALAAEIQAEVDALLAANPDMNKVILAAHMQVLDFELELAARLTDVDIIIAGGSDTRLFDDNDVPRAGDSDQGQYPQFVTNAGGTTAAVVNTDGQYLYVGRLVIDFDADGNIIPSSYDEEVSGAYATDAAGVAALGAEALVDPEIQAIADALAAQIQLTEGNVFGISDVFLNGNRNGVADDPADPDGVRSQETNLGNLTADANLAAAQEAEADVVVSIKNGGGIRASVGQTIVPAGSNEAVRLPNEALVDGDGVEFKPEGGISQTDIETTLAFNNGLTLLTLTKAELVAVLEHGVANVGGGQFAQVSGVRYSFDPDAAAGDRLQNAGIFDEDGTLIAELVRDGEIAGDAGQTFRIVTLSFMADGGDGYPFPTGPAANRVDLFAGEDETTRDGVATFANDGTEQDALAEYLAANFSTSETAFVKVDSGRDQDNRIQNLSFRSDAVFEEENPVNVIISEIMFNPASAEDDWEWVEVTNTGTEAVDLAGWVIDDGNNVFHSTANIAAGVIAAGESAVLYNADDVSAEDFAAAWGSGLNLIAVTGWSALALNNGGDIVALWESFADYSGDQTTFANVSDIVDYNPIGGLDDGAGSIFLTDLSLDNNDTGNWALSTVGGATPTGEGRQSLAEGGNSGGDVGSPGGDAEDAPVEVDPDLIVSVVGSIGLAGAEIVDVDAASQRAFVTSNGGLQVVDISDIANPVLETVLAAEDLGFDSSDVTSVSVRNGLVAVARPDPTGVLDGTSDAFTGAGQVLFYSAETLQFLGVVQVGALPDMLTFNADGTVLLVANEGQSSGEENEPDASQNPLGSVSVIQVNAANPTASAVTTLDFTDPSITFESLAAKSVRVNTSAPSAAADIEPEYITIQGNTAYIALQENNAVAVIEDITNPAAFTIDQILALGTKDHSAEGNGLDASNEDGGINIDTYDVRGLFMPDGMASMTIGGQTFFLTANEGDGRGVDESRGADLVDGDPSNGEVDAGLDPALLAQLADDALLGRLKFSNVDGDTDGDGDIDVLHSFGGRSFTIFDADGNVVFDSGDDFEVITAALSPEEFNSNGNAGDFDSRSDDKGPEPEAVVVGEIEGRTYAFIALERTGGVMVYDVTDPANATFDQYIRNEDESGNLIDIAPEGLRFISADESPNGKPLLAVASEESNTLTFHQVEPANPIRLVSEIQGETDFSGLSGFAQVGVDDRSAFEGQTVRIEAIVTADMQFGAAGTLGSDLSGFFVQEEDADSDGNAATSEGIFVFEGDDAFLTDVEVGDLVIVEGTVTEFFGMTQITATSIDIVSSGNALPTATTVTFPTTGVMLDDDGNFVADLEAVEGMRVTIETEMSVTEMFNLDRFGEYRVSADGRLEQFTQSNAPDQAGFAQHLEDIAARSIVFDDGRDDQNPEALEIIDGNNGVLDAADSFRMGDTITNATGVINYSFDEFRLHDATGDYEQQNPRPATPDEIGGTFKVASLNVLNYFTTIDTGADNGGPNDDQEPRGADSVEEFERQATKTVNAIVAMDADVLGLIEIENDDDEALADLVGRVNDALGSEVYGFIATGDLGGDAITQALIYKLDKVAPVGDFAALFEFNGRDFIDPLNAGTPLNRPALAQTFEDLESGEQITIAVNHLKSKGSLSGLAADEDQLDGAGNNNATRAEAASILAEWLASDPTGTGAANQLIIGDLNSYAQEDPIQVLKDAGFTDIAFELLGADASSFVFDGQTGTLDYALANQALFEKIAGVTEWHVNADEADAIDYNLDFGRDPALFDGTTPARNSDHDPVIVSFDFTPIILGTAGRDKLVGTERGEIIDGLGGNDMYKGKGGADTFVMGAGDVDRVLDFEEGIDLVDISAWGTQSIEELTIIGHRGRLTVIDNVSGDRALIQNGDRHFDADDLTAESFIFAPVEDLTLTGGNGFDRLVGRAGDDVLDGAGGHDYYIGNGGADTFVLGTSSFDKVADFEDGIDRLDISQWGVAGIDDLDIRNFGGGRFVLIRDDAGHRAVICGDDGPLDAALIGADDFIFTDTLV